MAVEIVWQAYDPAAVDDAWSRLSVKELYDSILKDEYRRRVDLRSMLFHREQHILVDDLLFLMKRGVVSSSLEKYWLKVLKLGFEDFPVPAGDMALDYRIISYFTSLRMADDYNRTEEYLKALFNDNNDKKWSFYDLEDIDEFFSNLGEVAVQDLARISEQNSISFDALVSLVQNYVEFYRYAKNNHLHIFFFNSASNIIKWGNLAERKRRRISALVDALYSKNKRSKNNIRSSERSTRTAFTKKRGLLARMREQRRREQFIKGLSDPDPLIRQKAIEYMAVPGDTEAVKLISPLLSDERPEVKQEVARALGEIGGKEALKILIEIVKSEENPAVLRSAAHSVRSIGDRSGILPLVDLQKSKVVDISAEIAFFPNLASFKRVHSEISGMLKSSDPRIRADAAFISGFLPKGTFTGRLISLLNDDDIAVVECSAASLGRRREKDARGTIKTLLKDTSLDQRTALFLTNAVKMLSR